MTCVTIDLEGTPEKKEKQFDFFYKRTCFRIMGEWYKQKFRAFTEVNPEVASEQ